MRNRLSCRVALTCLSVLIGGSCSSEPVESDFVFQRQGDQETVAVLETVAGEIVIRFYPREAPRHVRNFLELCGSGFYDGTDFHRVAPGFLIQGGDPNTKDEDRTNDGKGGNSFLGAGTTLEPEFNRLSHEPGMVSMARSSSPDSAGSQFFIMVGEDPSLDGRYTVFGKVIEGMEAVEKISEEPGMPYPELGGFQPEVKQTLEKCRIEMRRIAPRREESAGGALSGLESR